jgi:hypothetical protein
MIAGNRKVWSVCWDKTRTFSLEVTDMLNKSSNCTTARDSKHQICAVNGSATLAATSFEQSEMATANAKRADPTAS